MTHHANQADSDNLEWQTKVTALQVKIDELTSALTHAVSRGGNSNGRQILEDLDKFRGTEKDIAKQQ